MAGVGHPLIDRAGFNKVRQHVEDAIARGANCVAGGTPPRPESNGGQDPRRARRVISILQFGHVGHNSGTGPTPDAPFGGMKQSGFGREGGLEGLMEFAEPQTEAATIATPVPELPA